MVSEDVIVLLHLKIIQVDNEDLELARKNLIKSSVHYECTHTLKKKLNKFSYQWTATIKIHVMAFLKKREKKTLPCKQELHIISLFCYNFLSTNNSHLDLFFFFKYNLYWHPSLHLPETWCWPRVPHYKVFNSDSPVRTISTQTCASEKLFSYNYDIDQFFKPTQKVTLTILQK